MADPKGASGGFPSAPKGSGAFSSAPKGGDAPSAAPKAKGAYAAAPKASGAFAAAGPTLKVPAGDPSALARMLAEAPPRATLLVPEGTYAGPLVVRREVAIKGAGPLKTRISGGGRDPVVLLLEAGARLRLSQVTLVEGAAAQGAGITVMAGRALVEDCVILGCKAGTGGGAGYVAAGDLALRRVLVHRCAAPIGGGLLLDDTASVALDDVVVEDNDSSEGGGFFLREGARLSLSKAFVRRNGAARGASAIEAQGTLSRAPRIEVDGGALAGGRPTVRLLAPREAKARPVLASKGATLAAEVKALAGFQDGGGNTFV